MQGSCGKWCLKGVLAGLLVLLCACGGKERNDLLQEGKVQYEKGNFRGAIVLFKNLLDQDANDFRVRFLLADSYLQAGKLEIAEKEFRKVAIQSPGFPGLNLKMAELYNRSGRPREATAAAGKELQLQPENAEAWKLSGLAEILQGNLEAGETRLRQANRLAPRDTGIQMELAACLVRNRKTDEAQRLLEDLVARDGNNIEALQRLARLENALGRQERSLELFRRITQIDPGQVDAWYMTGLLLLEKRDTEGAEKIAGQLQGKFPDSNRGLQLTGLVRYFRGEFEEAVVCLQKASGATPDLLSFYMLGMSFYNLGKFELASNQFQRFLDYRPDAAQPRIVLGLIHLRQNRPEQAVGELERALKADEASPLAHSALASALLALGRYDQAMAEFDRAIALDPGLAQAHLRKGLFNLARGNVQEGEESLARALSILPEAPDVRLLLAGHYLREKKYPEAIATLKAGMTGRESDAVFYNYLAAAYLAQKNTEEMVAALQRAKEIKPDYLTPSFNLAAFYATGGDYGKANREYRAILAKKPDDPRALFLLGQTAELAGRTEEAARYFRRLVEVGASRDLLGLANYFGRTGRREDALSIIDEAGRKEAKNPLVPELRGKILLAAGRHAEAIEAFRYFDRLAPGKGLPLVIEVLLRQGENKKAEELARDLIQQSPASPAGHLSLSRVLEQSGRLPEAIKDLQNAGAGPGGSPALRLRLAELHEKNGETAHALAHYEELVAADPQYYPALFAIGSLHERAGRIAQAIGYYRQAIDMKEDFAPALNNLAYLYAGTREFRQEALDLALRAFQAQSEDPAILDTLGFALWRNGRLQEARKALEKTVSLLPKEPTVHYHLALVYHQLGRESDSVQSLRSAIALGPFPEAAEARSMFASLTEKAGGPL